MKISNFGVFWPLSGYQTTPIVVKVGKVEPFTFKVLRARENGFLELNTNMEGHRGLLFMREAVVNNSDRKRKLEQRL